ncbi:hypothetical protein [Sulfobacillus harzensis]|uniref:Uncharacterized protein n=1 Tax=Sulfobacillus harzensis TaxID=2729629 RepID=A0A7Y0L3W2_9FIRM|nr:hypothetical protein [Sulfobacillus harzensis]NMP22603.1 hypothetical protein [Sulfobacillus harzensis]
MIDQSSHDRVMHQVMAEIRQLPLPRRSARRLWVAMASFYGLLVAGMVWQSAMVLSFWQWMLSAVWVAGLEWLAFHLPLVVETAVLLIFGLGFLWHRGRGPLKERNS